MAVIGLRNIVVVKLEEDLETGAKYAKEIKKLNGARLVNMEPQIAEGNLYGDDQLIENESSVASLNVSIETTDLTLEEEAFLLGHKIVDGVMVENKDDAAPDIAIGFMAPKSKRSGGGFRRVWLLKCTGKPTGEEIKTKEDNIEYQTPKIDYIATPRLFDGKYRIKSDSTDEGAPTDEDFFSTTFLEKGKVQA